jgi:D-threo-aldose 1-dehydrogenase
MTATFRAPIGRSADELDGRPDARTDVRSRADGIVSPAGAQLGFGCAGLLRSPSAQHRQRLLAEAFEQGIRHFDVARMYGLGAAEGELGRFAKGRREQLTIATKFGIEPTGTAGRLGVLQAPARALVARAPALRQALKRRADAFHQPHHYDPATARRSLETSLRELQTDYVDILFVHGPEPRDALDVAELSETLEQLRGAGHLRAWGFAGDPACCRELSEQTDVPTVLQVSDDIFEQALPPIIDGPPTITFGVLADALERIVRHVGGDPARRRRWREQVGEDCAHAETVASLLLGDALDRNRGGTVLFSTTRPERIGPASAIAHGQLAGSPPLEAFRELAISELAAPVQASRRG